MAWKGRQLTGYAKNGTMSTFSYDADGLRGSKTVGGVKTVYQYVGDKLYYEKRGDSQEFYYFYDSYGKLATVYYSLNTDTSSSRAIYHTLTNAQGDVIAIYNNTGALVASYEYDAWGNILSVKDASGNAITQQNHIANANPIRYRGYYYDADLGLYYLQSRYYDSETGRFINADGYITTGQGVLSHNMFAYGGNNPVNMCDPSGEIATEIFIGIAIGIIFVATVIGGAWGAMADEPLFDKALEAKEKEHRDANPANNNPLHNNNSNNSSNNNDDKIKGDSDTACKTTPELSAADRAANIFIGATLGLAAGGAIVMVAALPVGLSGKLKIGYQMFAIGASAFNLEAMVFAPFYAVALEPIEWEQ